MPAPGGRSTRLGEARSAGLRSKPPLLVTKQGSGVRVRTGQRAAGLLPGTWSGSAEVPCCLAPPAALSEAPDMDGERSFWSTGPGGRLSSRDVAALHTEGLPAAGRERRARVHIPDTGAPAGRGGAPRFTSNVEGQVRTGHRYSHNALQTRAPRCSQEREPGGRSQNLSMAEDPHSPFPFPQGELFLFFSSDVVSDGTEIIIVFNQEILHVKIITKQCFQTSF